MERQEMQTPEETRKAEKMMTPVQAAMTKARYEVESHKEDLMAAGVSEQQVEKASLKAGERAESEFEKKENEDPLCRIERVLETAAETPEEKQLAQEGIKRLEEFRLRWVEMLRGKKLRAKNEGKEFRINEAVHEAKWSNTAPTFVDARTYGLRNSTEYFPRVNVLNTLVIDKGKGTRIEPPVAFMERVLRGMGVLKPDQKLDALRSLPEDERGYKGPVYRSSHGFGGCAERIPTNITGVDARVDFERPNIYALMNLQTLANVVNFPEA